MQLHYTLNHNNLQPHLFLYQTIYEKNNTIILYDSKQGNYFLNGNGCLCYISRYRYMNISYWHYSKHSKASYQDKTNGL